MSKEEIKHCPNCGGAAKVRHDDQETWVECKKCHMRGRRYPLEVRAYAIEDWNSLGENDNV